MGKALLQDRVALAIRLGLLLGVPLGFLVISSGSSLALSALEAATLVFAIATCLTRLQRRPRVEQRFWGLIAAGLTCWLGVHALEVSIDGEWAADARLSVLGDTGYMLLYLAFILALELRPHADRAAPRLLGLVGALVFVLSLFAYFVVVSVVFEPASYFGWVPSSTLWAIFDLYLVARLAILAVTVSAPAWRAAYAWMLAAALGWATLDGSDLLRQLDVMVHPAPRGVLDTLWFVTPLFLALAVRAQRLPASPGAAVEPERGSREEGEARQDPEEDPLGIPFGGSLFANALLVPGVHALVLLSPTASSALAGPRHVVAFTAMAALLVMAVVSQRWLAARTERLIAERAEFRERALLGQRLEALGRLAGGVAHEFNNLMQVIRLGTEGMLADLAPGSPARQHAADIARTAESATQLIARLLSLSRKEEVRTSEFDLNAAVERTSALLRHVIGSEIRLEVALEPGGLPVHADRAQLELALLNLGVNARDALPSGGRIRIATRRGEPAATGWAWLEVTDDGTGMDEETRARIFDPFFTTKRDGAGTGLGLTLVKSFVELSHGRIEVASTPGWGTSFRLSLPLSTSAVMPEPLPEPDGEGRVVLVVEDEPDVRTVLRGFLRESGFRLLEAGDGLEALELLERGAERPDCVLADLVLPRLGGSELARRLRARFPELPVFFMTGYAPAEHMPEESLLPPLQKPFSRLELVRHLRRGLVTVPARRGPRTHGDPELAVPSPAPGLREPSS